MPLGAVTVSTGVTLTVQKSISFVNLNLVGSASYKFGAAALTANFSGTITGTGSFSSFGTDANFNFTGSGSVGNLKNNGFINNLTINTPSTTSTLLSTLKVLGTVTVTDGTLNSNGFLILSSNPTRQGIINKDAFEKPGYYGRSALEESRCYGKNDGNNA